MKKRRPNHGIFPGFQRYYDFNVGGDGFTMYPTVMEEYWCDLTGSEQKVLDFVIRMTFGWHKSSDKIGLGQFVDGVGGKSMNRGTGLSRSTVQRALKGLEEKGFITIKRRNDWVSTIFLVLQKDEAYPSYPGAKILDAFKNDKD